MKGPQTRGLFYNDGFRSGLLSRPPAIVYSNVLIQVDIPVDSVSRFKHFNIQVMIGSRCTVSRVRLGSPPLAERALF